MPLVIRAVGACRRLHGAQIATDSGLFGADFDTHPANTLGFRVKTGFDDVIGVHLDEEMERIRR